MEAQEKRECAVVLISVRFKSHDHLCSSMPTIYEELIAELKKNPQQKSFERIKVHLAKKFKVKKIPSTIDILLHASADDIRNLNLVTKPVRTISGVVPVAVMAKPHQCPHGKCIYCPGGLKSVFGDVPQSYSGRGAATMRAIMNDYDAYLQVFNRLEQYIILGHSINKVEIIVMGGTFLAMPKEYKESFIKDIFSAMNDFSGLFFQDGNFDVLKLKDFFELPCTLGNREHIARIHEKILKLKHCSTLDAEKLSNETSIVRCIGLTIETRPDFGMLEHANEMLSYGCTRVELGVQSVYEDVVKIVNRGHTVRDSINSIKTLKDLGFKINIHYMPGLPLTDRRRDLEGMKQLFENPDFRPDMLKIYPCMVSKGTKLYDDFIAKKFSPLSTDDAAGLIAEFKKFVPEYCRIQRIQRDVPTKFWDGGVGITNLRQYIHQKFAPECRCIRCREPQNRQVDWNSIVIKSLEYSASNGTEIFISAEDAKNDILLGFCRLRIPSQQLRKEFTKNSAIIRELHVYGSAVSIGEKGSIQHKGIGKKLLAEAEKIAVEQFKIEKLLVISGVGVREYYRKLGYADDGPYVAKIL